MKNLAAIFSCQSLLLNTSVPKDIYIYTYIYIHIYICMYIYKQIYIYIYIYNMFINVLCLVVKLHSYCNKMLPTVKRKVNTVHYLALLDNYGTAHLTHACTILGCCH